MRCSTILACLSCLVVAVDCSSTSGGGAGSPDGGSTHSTSGPDAGSTDFFAIGNGTFTGTTASGVSVSATITDAEMELEEPPPGTSGPQSRLLLAASLGTSGSARSVSVSSPAGVTKAGLGSTILIFGAPMSGAIAYTDSDVCGGLEFELDVGATTYAFATVSANSCSSPGMPSGEPAAGAWSVQLTSAKLPPGGAPSSGDYVYAPHGTLNGTLVSTDGSAGKGTLSLTF